MLNFFRSLYSPKLQSLNTILIDKRAIQHNLSYLQSLHPHDQIIPVLKSNAYGHGLQQMCQILQDTPVQMVAVDSFPEYQIVKKHTNKKVLIIGETDVRNYKYFNRKRASFAVYNLSTLEWIIHYKKPWRIHIFLNTWMNREWVQIHELDEFLTLLKNAPRISVEGIMSHFADADNVNSASMHLQVENFKLMHETILSYGFESQYRHISASAGALKLYDEFFNAQRIWFSLYGYNPLQESDEAFTKGELLQPAMRIYSSVVSLQDIGSWEGVGYKFSYQSPGETRVGTIPFGYFEWLPKVLSDNRQVKRKDTYLPLIGTISMNLSSVHVSEYEVAIGDLVEVLSPAKASLNTLMHMKKLSDMSPYELLVKISPTVKRKIV